MKSWPRDDLDDVREAMADRLAGSLLPGERLEVQGASSSEEVNATFVLDGGGQRVLLEARVDLLQTRLDEESARDLALDALDLVLQGWLESGREDRLTGVSEERELRGQVVWVRAERTFPDLEAQADALLGEGPKAQG